MTANSPVDSRKDGIVTAICVLVFMISTATGNAYVMLGAAVVTLAVVSVWYRERLGPLPLLAVGVAAVVACLVALSITLWA